MSVFWMNIFAIVTVNGENVTVIKTKNLIQQ